MSDGKYVGGYEPGRGWRAGRRWTDVGGDSGGSGDSGGGARTDLPIIPVNGVHRSTGGYAAPPLSLDGFSARVGGQMPVLPAKDRAPLPLGDHLADLATTGWGVVFAHDADEEVRSALGELLDHRRAQAGPLFREFCGDDGFLRKDSWWEWMKRHGAAYGVADPEQVPFYLLLVGDPESIPFDFQYGLAGQRAVGRLCFDRIEDYRTYARRVVETEQKAPARPRRVTLVGVNNPDDLATTYTTEDLVLPLVSYFGCRGQDWGVRACLGADAGKAALARLFGGGDDTPSLLFTASHGLAPESPDDPGDFGALLCQDWPGPRAWQAALPDEFVFGAEDVPPDADLSGLVTFHFACYSSGLPTRDTFAEPGKTGEQISSRPLLAALPRRQLAQGALASIGHVDRAWCCTFLGAGGRRQPETVAATVNALLEGQRVGAAVRYLTLRYLGIAPAIVDSLADRANDEEAPCADRTSDRRVDVTDRTERAARLAELSDQWLMAMDAKSYLVMGDPAVRMPAAV